MGFKEALMIFCYEAEITKTDIATALSVNIETLNEWGQGKARPNQSEAVLLLDYVKSKAVTSSCVENLQDSLCYEAVHNQQNNLKKSIIIKNGSLSEIRCDDAESSPVTTDSEVSAVKELTVEWDNPSNADNETEVIQLKSIFRNTNSGISAVIFDDNGTVRTAYANDRYYSIFGYTREQFMKELKAPHDTVYPDDFDLAAKAIARVKETKKAESFRYRIIKRDRSIAYVRCNSSITSINTTGSFALISSLTDITESVQAEQQAIVYGERLDAIMKNMNNAVTASVFRCDGTFEFLFTNDRYHEMLGYTEEQYQSEVHETFQCIYPSDLQYVKDAVISVREVGDTKELQYRIITREGKIKWLWTRITMMNFPDADAPVQLSVYSDITDIVEAQQKLASQHNQIAKLLSDTPSGIAIVEVDSTDIESTLHTTYYNDRFYSFSGYSREEYDAMLKKDEMSFVFQEDIHIVMDSIQRLCDGEIGGFNDVMVRSHVKDGSFRWLLLTSLLSERHDNICVINVSIIDVTRRQEAIDRQRINDEMLRIAIETDERSIIVYDVKNNTCRIESRTLFSVKYGDIFDNIPQSLLDRGVVAKDSKDQLCSMFTRIREGEKKIHVSLQLHNGPDQYEWFECNASTIFDACGLPDHAILVFHNVTEQRIKEAVFKKWQQSIDARPKESYTLFRCNLSKDASLDQQDGELLKISFPADAMSFNSRTKLYVDESVHPSDREAYTKLLNSDVLLAMYYRGEHFATLDYREISANKEDLWRHLTIEMVEYPNSTDVEVFLMYEDIDEQKRAEIDAMEIAKSDPLTGALNRAAFMEEVDKRIVENPSSKSALVMLDMDGFKQINDTFGHAAGDHALQEVVAVLRTYARHDDLVCRLGGDEFMVWLQDVPYDAVIGKVVQQMCEHIRKAYSQEVHLGVSAGIAVYPRDGKSYDELYHNSDKALYKMKQTGKGSYTFFSVAEVEQNIPISKAVSDDKKESATPINRKHRMLIVDADDANRLLLKKLFKDEYLVETAKNVTETMIRLRHFGASVSVVLLSLSLQESDGFRVLERMQNDVDLCTVPVIVFAGKEDHDALLKAFKLGAAEYVYQPVDVDILRIRVKSVINKAENERLRAQNSYLMLQRDEEVKYRTVLESTGTAVVEYDWRNHVYIYDSEISKHIAGDFNYRGLWQVLLSDMVADSNEVKILQDMLINLGSKRETKQDSKFVRLKTPKGIRHWFRVNFYKSIDDFGLAEKIIITFNDVHEEVLANDKLLFQATRDKLTGLYNRTHFLERASELISAQEPGYYVMVCIDIEKFQYVNDRYGTEKGDEVLKHIAESITAFEKTDGICCRYMADKFAIMYPSKLIGSSELVECYRVASSPSCIPHALRLRIGRCVINDTTLPASAFFDRAAMAEASAKGRYDKYIVEFDESMRDKLLKEQQVVGNMVEALQNGEFETWFQPQYNHATGALIGAEALVRWRRNRKIVPPNDFIPVFERNGFVYEVDRYIWRSVCVLLRRWLDEGKNPLPVSVNISRYDLLQKDFMDSICSLTEEFMLPVELLRLEVTESAFSSSSNVIYRVVNELINRGFTVEIDDFGSGYSSLNTLKDVPASILKLDMRFFERTGDAKRGGNIVESIVRMAKWLGMAIIAEGVEDKAQADYLKSIGCVYIQGYYYAKPMPTEEYEKRLEMSTKEIQLTHLQTLQHLDNNDFWDSHSMDTLIFNSYVGAACIFELCKGKVEMLRATDLYVQMLCDNALDVTEVLAIDWSAHMDSQNIDKFTDAVKESIETRNAVTWEFEFHDLPKCPDTVILRSVLRVIAVAGDSFLIYCLNENITNQRIAEIVAQSATERINAVMDNSHCGISAVVARPDGTVDLIFVNNRFFEILGYTREQYMKEVNSPYDRVLPEDKQKVFQSITKLKKIGSTVSLELQEMRRDGSIVWLRCDASIVKFANVPEPVQLASFLDITKQKEDEIKQLESAHKLEVIMSNVNGGVSALQVFDDATSKVVFNNDRYYELYGYTKEEALEENLDVMKLILPEDIPMVMRKIKQMKKDHRPALIDYRIKKKDGRYCLLRANASLMSIDGYEDDVITSVVTDITERKSLEDRLDAIINNINGGISAIYLLKDKIDYVIANEQYYRILGYTKEEYESKNMSPLDLIHPDDLENVKKKLAESQKVGERYTMEYRIIRGDGEVRNILCNTSILQLFGTDEPLQLAITNDITELREIQRKEIAIRDRLSTVMNTMSNAMTAVALHEDGMEFLFANNRFYEMYGIKQGTIGVNHLPDALKLITNEYRETVRSAIHEAAKTMTTVCIEYQILRPDGVMRWVRASINMTKLADISDPVQVTVLSDITDEKNASEQLRFLNESSSEILAQPNSEKAINDTLSKLQRYFASDCVYIMELRDETRTSAKTYEICAEGIHSEIEKYKSVPYEVQQQLFDALEESGFVAISDVAELSGENEILMRKLRLKHNIHSMIVAPLWRDDKLIGYIGINNPTNAIDQVNQLMALADYIAVLLTRRDLMKTIEHERQNVQQLMDDTPGGFLRLQILPDGTPVIVSLNTGFCRMLGMTTDEVMLNYGNDAHKCLVSEDITTVKTAVEQALNNSDSYTYRCRLKRKNGTVIWVQVFGRYVKDENGDLYRNSFFTDIAEKLSTEEKQKILLDNLPFGAAMYEFDGKRITVNHINQQYWKLVNRKPQKYEKTSIIDAIHPDDRMLTIQEIKTAIRQERNACVDLRILDGNGGYLPFHVTASIVPLENGKYQLFVAYLPISDNTMSLQELLPIALSTMMATSDDISYIKGQDMHYIACSLSMASLTGFTDTREIIGKSAYDLFDSKLADKFTEDDQAVIETGIPVVDYIEHIPSAGGDIILFRTSKYPIRDASGSVIGVYCTSHDITAQTEKESQLELLTDTIPGGIATFRITSEQIEVLYYNDGVCALLGYSREDYASLQVPLIDFIFAEDRMSIRKQIDSLGEKETIQNLIFRAHHKHGGYRYISASVRVVDKLDESYTINTVLTDVTEQQKEKENLRLAEEEYRIATEHSERTICRYNIADMTLKVSHETATRLALPYVIKGVPYEQSRNDTISSDTVENYVKFFERIRQGEKTNDCVFCKKLNNRWRWLSARSTSIFDLSGQPVKAIISFRDITEAQEKELIYKKWKQSLTIKKQEQYTLFRCNLNKDASYDTKEGTLFSYTVTDAKEKMFNKCTSEFCNEFVAEDDKSKYIRFLDSNRLLAGYYRGERSGELIFRAIFGEEDIRWIHLSVELLEYPDSTDVEAYLMYEDINDSVMEELNIKKMAETDSLTGLQNRKVFISRVNEQLAHSEKQSCRALFLLDIDYFKHINDTYGHSVGDEAIIRMAEVISTVVQMDGFVCRLGGDEFIGYLSEIPSRELVADKVREICESAHLMIMNETQISVSIGIALVTEEEDDFDSLYHKADKALYHVKSHGRNNFSFYDGDMERDDNEVISEAVSDSLIHLPKGKNIMLIVDDSAINRLVTAGMFRKEFSIIEAENGQVALNYLQRHSEEIAIVLLDVMMPVMDGYQLLEAMRREALLHEVPVIVISGEDDRKASLRAIQAGASEYIAKPVDSELLRLRVSSVLSKFENASLRKQNTNYAIDNQELRSYRSLMDSNATILVEYITERKAFKYAPKTSTFLAGTFDERPIWQIFAEDRVASADDTETIRRMITEMEKPCKAMLNLLTPDGTKHTFLVKVILCDDTDIDDVVLMTLTDRK